MIDKSILVSVVGALGGVARLFADYMTGDRAFVAWHIIAAGFIGCFLGFMGGELARVTGFDDWSYISAGALGGSGVEGLNYLMRRVKKQVDPS